MIRSGCLTLLVAAALAAGVIPKRKGPEVDPVDLYVQQATRPPEGEAAAPSPGSLWSPTAQYADLGRDLKASMVNDIVTIRVSESASAVSTGATKTERKSTLSSNITALAGVTKAAGPWANLAGLNSDTKLDGAGTTSRQTTLSTTLTARVVRVLPNGYLVLQGDKDIQVNSERQRITVRGVVRPSDLASDNSVPSNRLAQMEVKLNGKGVVGDSIRRPFILYRLLLGLLPF
jgi:flagellar L-ring protein FlgH